MVRIGARSVFPHTRIRGPSLYYFRKVGGRVVQIRIGRLDEGETVLRKRYQELLTPQPRTVADLLGAWLTEAHDIRPKTRQEYERNIRAKLVPVFGSIPLTALRSSHIAQFLERRGNVAGNREVACLASVIEWGRRQGWIDSNPCQGVRRNRERSRQRYVTHRELGQALKRTTPEFRDFMLAGYFTGFRQGDLRALRRTDLSAKGIKMSESKTGKQVAMRWSKPLRACVDRCMERHHSDRVFTDTRGQAWSLWAVQSAMRRLDVDWTFHDLRRKAESDHKKGLGLLSRYKRAWDLEPVR